MSPTFPIHENGKTKKYTSQNMEWGGAVFFLLSPFWSGNKGGPNKKSSIRKKGGRGKQRSSSCFFFPESKTCVPFPLPSAKKPFLYIPHMPAGIYASEEGEKKVYESHFCIGGKGRRKKGGRKTPLRMERGPHHSIYVFRVQNLQAL